LGEVEYNKTQTNPTYPIQKLLTRFQVQEKLKLKGRSTLRKRSLDIAPAIASEDEIDSFPQIVKKKKSVRFTNPDISGEDSIFD